MTGFKQDDAVGPRKAVLELHALDGGGHECHDGAVAKPRLPAETPGERPTCPALPYPDECMRIRTIAGQPGHEPGDATNGE